MITIIAEADSKTKKVIKNVKPGDVERKIQDLYDRGYTRVTVERPGQ